MGRLKWQVTRTDINNRMNINKTIEKKLFHSLFLDGTEGLDVGR